MLKRRKKTRVRKKNMGFKKLIILFLLIFIIIQLLTKVIVPGAVTVSRYMYSVARGYYLNTKKFYFNSDKLSDSLNPAHFKADNWSGVDPYEITIKVNSRKNNIEFAPMDIEYDIEATYTVFKSDGTEYENAKDLVMFSLLDKENVTSENYTDDNGKSKIRYTTNGVIYASTQANNQDYFRIKFELAPNVSLNDNDYVYIQVKANSVSPYKVNLEGDFKVYIGNLGMSYKIEDSAYNPYLNVIVTNTLDYYTADSDFSYTSSDGQVVSCEAGKTIISISDYINCLTEDQKKMCHSMNIQLDFNPENVVMDTTSNAYLISESQGNTILQDKSGYQYVNSIKFALDAEESKVIKFYKIDSTKDYTYPLGDLTQTPVVKVSYE